MTEIALEEISHSNLQDVLQVEVLEHQADFVPSIESSIELASNYDDACCKAIRFGGAVCGFGLYGIDQETGSWKIYRLVIDRRFQGRGIGKGALGQILDILRAQHQAEEVLIVYASENATAHQLYSSFGFVPYGAREDRILSKLNLNAGI